MLRDYDQRFFDAVKKDIEQARIRRPHVYPENNPLLDAGMELDRRLSLYKTTGNRDYLVDVAKYAHWEWLLTE